MYKTFYVFFTSAVQLPWYLKGIEKSMSHCFTIEHQELGGYDCFMALEHLTNYIDTGVYLVPIEDVIDRLRMTKPYKIIKINIEVNPFKSMNIMPLDCASLVKKSLGINRPLVFTPKQLYKHLLSIGGKEI